MYGNELAAEYRKKMDDMLEFVEDYSKRLMRPVKDLEDVRQVMEALSTIRDNYIQMDMILGPIEV